MTARPPARAERLTYFFPAHNEEANLAPLVEEALATLPELADEFEIVVVDDGSRDATPRIADELAAAHPDVVVAVHHPTNLGYGAALVGYRIRRADPLVRTVYARLYRLANRIFFGLRVRDVDCACKLFRRSALAGLRVESGGAFFSAELLIKLRASGAQVVEVGVPHYPRTAGSPTGAKPQVILRAMRDFWRLRLHMWVNRDHALRRGWPIQGEPPA